jgi:16S rRNA (cytidine1402-2'-O)-methyltransferase
MTGRSKREGRGAGPRGTGGDASGPRGEGEQQAGGAATLPGGLYLVATPIGNARDITLRALDVLAGADAIAAEDTRETLKLMEMHGIPRGGRPVIAYHDRNGPAVRPTILAMLREGRSVACCSDAGTPMVADPGYRLVEAALAEDLPVTAVPGPSAALAALTLSGLPTDRFLFAGFLPAKQGARRAALAELGAVPATLVVFESPHRVAATLADMAEVLGGERPAALLRELTKRFETAIRGDLAGLAARFAAEPRPKGEIVLVIGRGEAAQAGAADLDAALGEALARGSVRDAAAEVAARFGLPKREVYARAITMMAGD